MLHEEVHEQLCQLPRIPGIEAEDLTSGNVTFFKAGAFMPKCRDEMARHLSSAASATKALSKPAGMPITFIWFFRCDLIPTGRFLPYTVRAISCTVAKRPGKEPVYFVRSLQWKPIPAGSRGKQIPSPKFIKGGYQKQPTRGPVVPHLTMPQNKPYRPAESHYLCLPPFQASRPP